MKYCTSCGKEQQEQAVFCSACGFKSGEALQSSKAIAINTDEVKEKMASTIVLAKENLQKSGYVNYVKSTLIRPSSVRISDGGKNGWIHLLVLTVATTFALYMIIRSAITFAFNQVGLGAMFGLNDAIIKEVRNAIIPRLTVVSFSIYVVLIATAFLSLKIMTKNKQTFNQTLSQFGGLLTPNIIIALTVGILSWLVVSEDMIKVSTVLLAFTLLLCLASYNFYLYKNAAIDGLDKFYVLLISNVVLLLIVGVLLYIQVEPILDTIENLNSYSNYFNW